ncbi:MAG: isoprenylcysteine carboxylmethyltransferase family protein [Terriglobia bacterium]|jgi:protein-S-isoprenylcysteine O-methyltransferase Ste14|nr:isoprenylcysteine carboxylmethyltransferase family protein [Terriglobia bacterium]
MSTAPQPSPEKKWNPRILIVINATYFLLFLVVTLLIMRKWASPDPWSALDANVITILVFSLVYCFQQLILYPSVFKTRESMNLFVGKAFDPKMSGILGILGTIELLAFADYAHWHLVAALRTPLLQIPGLVVMFTGLTWLFYVDRYMGAHFLEAWTTHKLMTGGPYRYMRHPRYLALLLSRVGFALAISSIIALLILPGWFAAVWLRMKREEQYLLGEFNGEYEEVMRQHARLLPGVY